MQDTGNKARYVDNLKRIALLDAGAPLDKVDNLIKYIRHEDEKEIGKMAKAIAKDLTVTNETPAVESKVINAWKV